MFLKKLYVGETEKVCIMYIFVLCFVCLVIRNDTTILRSSEMQKCHLKCFSNLKVLKNGCMKDKKLLDIFYYFKYVTFN